MAVSLLSLMIVLIALFLWKGKFDPMESGLIINE